MNETKVFFYLFLRGEETEGKKKKPIYEGLT